MPVLRYIGLIASLLCFDHALAAVEPCDELAQMPPGKIIPGCRIHPCAPWYPMSAIRERREGRVALMVAVDTEGNATSASVTASSSSFDLDQAAVRNVERYAFPVYFPPGSESPRCYRAPFPINFELRGAVKD